MMNTANKACPEWLSIDFGYVDQVRSYTAALILLGIFCYFFITIALDSLFFRVKVPFVGYRSFLEPTWLVRLHFVIGGRAIIQTGYERFKHSMFQVRRLGTDIVVLSPKYVEEVRKLSRDKTRSVEPFLHDFTGDYTQGIVFLQSDLQNRVIQQRLNPSLGSLTSVMKTELDLAFQKEVPSCEDQWVAVDMNHILVRIIARISARVFLGPKEGRNDEWITTIIEYTKNLFITGFILRVFPKYIRPLVAPLLPSYRGLNSNIVAARRIIGGIVRSRQTAEVQSDSQYEKPTDILQWMMDAATGEEKKLENLSQRILILSLASIHTSALTMTQALYDLCANPEYFEPLRQELIDVLLKHGGWQKIVLSNFIKLDSFLKESQRLNAVFLLTFNRIFHNPMKLSNGTFLPAGTRVAAPSHAISQDSAHVPGPTSASQFDPFRYSRIREDPAHPENLQKFLFTSTDSSNMAFGYGKYACPGRFYASHEMKLILAHLLLRYDIKLPDGCGRPRNFTIDSDMFPDPRARLLIRKRDIADPEAQELIGSFEKSGE